MKFKAGDKVRRLKRYLDSYSHKDNPIRKISNVYEQTWGQQLEFDGKERWDSDKFELVTEDKTSKAYLQSFVNKANE